MAYEEKVKLIEDGSITNCMAGQEAVGFLFKVKLYTYRGTYLSCIEKLALKLDGEAVDMDQVVFGLNGKRFLVNQLKELFAEYWYILDRAELIVYKDGGLTPGSHELALDMSIRIPYSGYFGSYHCQDASEVKVFSMDGGCCND